MPSSKLRSCEAAAGTLAQRWRLRKARAREGLRAAAHPVQPEVAPELSHGVLLQEGIAPVAHQQVELRQRVARRMQLEDATRLPATRLPVVQ